MTDTLHSDRKTAPTLALVIPCYNESEMFSYCLDTLGRLLTTLIQQDKIRENSYILFIDDGSKDDSWDQICKAGEQYSYVKGTKLSRNCGHQLALLAGLTQVSQDAIVDVCISIDADLQDDIQCIEQMIDRYRQGYEIVYGVRNDRSTDSFFKRNTAGLFYYTMQKMGVNQICNHADYRMLDKRALECFLAFKERNVYIRGIIPLLGFKSDKVFYTRAERQAGETKYPLRKMLSLALEGITSFTITPLRLISAMGMLVCLFSLLAIAYVLLDRFMGYVVPGWSSIIISIFFLSGVQLLSLGIIGEYIGKIYMEVKKRPKFFIDQEINR